MSKAMIMGCWVTAVALGMGVGSAEASSRARPSSRQVSKASRKATRSRPASGPSRILQGGTLARGQQRLRAPKRLMRGMLSRYRKRARSAWRGLLKKLRRSWSQVKGGIQRLWQKATRWLTGRRKKQRKGRGSPTATRARTRTKGPRRAKGRQPLKVAQGAKRRTSTKATRGAKRRTSTKATRGARRRTSAKTAHPGVRATRPPVTPAQPAERAPATAIAPAAPAAPSAPTSAAPTPEAPSLPVYGPPAAAPSPATPATTGTIFPFRGYRQCTGPWRDVVLGGGPSTICGAGCALTSLAMFFQFYGLDLEPQALNALMQQKGFFSGDMIAPWPGELVGKRMMDSWEGSRSTSADWEANWEANATKALRLVHENFAGDKPRPMIGQVDYNNDSDHKGNHFVLIAGVDANGEPLLFDPGSLSSEPMPGPMSAMRRKDGMILLRVLWVE